MMIKKNTVVTINFTVYNESKTERETKKNFEFVFASYALPPELELSIEGLETGDKFSCHLNPAEISSRFEGVFCSEAMLKSKDNFLFVEGQIINARNIEKGRYAALNMHSKVTTSYFSKAKGKIVGETLNNKFNGSATITYSNGNSYEGEVKDNLKEGIGILRYADGDVYFGGFKADKKEGNGTYIYSNGVKYEGQFKDDLKSGHGYLFLSNGDTYLGEFQNNNAEGQGTLNYANGSKFSGLFSNGNPKEGTYTNTDGESITGYVKDGKIHAN